MPGGQSSCLHGQRPVAVRAEVLDIVRATEVVAGRASLHARVPEVANRPAGQQPAGRHRIFDVRYRGSDAYR
jgi:hypothetical protein